MSAAQITLEYELTQDEMRAEFDRHISRVRSRGWGRKLAAVLCLLLLVSGWDSHPWWIRGLLLCLTAQMLLFDRWLGRWMSRSLKTFRFVIETDGHGIRIDTPYEKTSPTRFWWSRLSGIEKTDFGVELYFDKQPQFGLEIPWKAFADNEQRRDFLDLLEQHLSKARS